MLDLVGLLFIHRNDLRLQRLAPELVVNSLWDPKFGLLARLVRLVVNSFRTLKNF